MQSLSDVYIKIKSCRQCALHYLLSMKKTFSTSQTELLVGIPSLETRLLRFSWMLPLLCLSPGSFLLRIKEKLCKTTNKKPLRGPGPNQLERREALPHQGDVGQQQSSVTAWEEGNLFREGYLGRLWELWGLKRKAQVPSAEDRKERPWTPPKIASELGETGRMASAGHGLQKLAGFQHGTRKTLCLERKILSVEIADANRFGGKSLLWGLVNFCCSGRSGDKRRRMGFVEERVFSWQWQKRNCLFWEKLDKLNSRRGMQSFNTSEVVSVN